LIVIFKQDSVLAVIIVEMVNVVVEEGAVVEVIVEDLMPAAHPLLPPLLLQPQTHPHRPKCTETGCRCPRGHQVAFRGHNGGISKYCLF
jgi:hypothetical protein